MIGNVFILKPCFLINKSRGFNLHKSHYRYPERLSRLMIPIALAYIWLVYLGEYAFDKGYNTIIHRTDRCALSLFNLGKKLLKYLIKQDFYIPEFCRILPDNRLNL